MRNWHTYYSAGDRARMMERARDEANAREYPSKPDHVDLKRGIIMRYFFGWKECGEVLKDGRFTLYGKVAGKIVDGRTVYCKEE